MQETAPWEALHETLNAWLDRLGRGEVGLEEARAEVQSIPWPPEAVIALAEAERANPIREVQRSFWWGELLRAAAHGHPLAEAHVTLLWVRAAQLLQPPAEVRPAVQQALQVFQEEGHDAQIASAEGCLGLLALREGRYREAEEHIRRALVAVPETDHRLQAALWNYLGSVQHLQGAYREALAAHRRAIRLARRAGTADVEAEAWVQLANNASALGRWRQARNAYETARRLAVESGPVTVEGQALANLGTNALLVGDYETALGFAEQASQLAQRHGIQAIHRVALGVSAAALEALGRRAEAIERYRTSIALAQQLRDANGEALQRGNLGHLYRAMGEWEPAEAELRQALAVAQAHRLPRAEAAAWGHLGGLYREQGRYPEALEALERALALDEASGVRYQVGLHLLNLGRTYLAVEDWEAAETFLRRALAVGQELSNRYLQADAAGRLGEVRAARGDWEGAAEYFRSARRQARRIGHAEDQARFAAGLGRVWAEGRGRPKRALYYYEEALTALESLRTGLAEEHHRLALMEQHQALYAAAVWAAAWAGAWETALEWTERARSRAIADLLQAAGGLPEPAESAGGEAARQLSALRARLRALYAQEERQAREGRSRGVREALRAERQAAESAYEQAWQALRRVRPEVAALWRTEALKLEEMGREALRPEEVALVFFALPGEMLVFVVGPGGLRGTASLPLTREALYGLVRRSRPAERPDAWGQRAITPTLSRLDLARAWERLIQPTEGLLQGCQRLVVVPHGPLHYLPFAALGPEGSPPLVDCFPEGLVQVPSLTVRRECLRRGAERAKRERALLLVNPRTGRPPLPGADAEAERIAACFPHAALCRREAAIRAALEAEASQADALHVATHGLFATEYPMFSALLLAPSETSPGPFAREETEDRWTVHDFYGLRLRAGLVTLGACLSGMSAVRPGDELVGLARGLFAAGVPTAVVSLWELHDFAAAVLFSEFYCQWTSSTSITFALKQAQARVHTLTAAEALAWLRELRTRQTEPEALSLIEAEIARLDPFPPAATPYADPYFWAGVVALGAGE